MYKIEIIFELYMLDLGITLPKVIFVHPQALFRNATRKTYNNPYELPFDLKLEASYTFKDLLRLKTSV